MSGFHLRATGDRWREGIVVIAIVVPVVMKWVDEWPADITLGPEQNIYSRRLQERSENERTMGEGERKIADDKWVGASYTMATDQSTLGHPPLVRVLGLSSSLLPSHSHLHARSKATTPKFGPAGLSTIEGRRIYFDDDFSGRISTRLFLFLTISFFTF